jgi:hypothetical protein
MPRAFFQNHVLPNYTDWLAAPLNQRLAKNVVADANNMAARVFRYWQGRDAAAVYGTTSEGKYRDALVERECKDFGLLRDIADAHKHFQLDRPSRRLSRSDQTGEGALSWGEARWGEGVYGGGPQLVVTLDDGSKRPLSAIVNNVIEMWERLLTRWSL